MATTVCGDYTLGTRTKDPDANQRFPIAWGAFLGTGVSIVTSSWSDLSGALTFADETIDGQTVVARVAGGLLGGLYRVTNRIQTSQDETLDASFWLYIVEK